KFRLANYQMSKKQTIEEYDLAFQHFRKQEYDKTLSILNKIEESNVATQHNILITKFMKNEIQEEQLFQQLDKLSEQTPAVLYNKAVLLYKYQRFEQVVLTLNPLFQKIDTLD